MVTNGKSNLNPSDFNLCPAWKYDENSDFFYPVKCEEDLPQSPRDLIIRAAFTTPFGDQLEGYIVGVERVFSIGLFLNERIYHVNKNLLGPSKEQVEEFLANRGGATALSFESVFPLCFETRWQSDTFVDFSGVFYMS